VFALERDQRRLHAYTEGAHRVFLAVEIDDEIDKIFELWIGYQLAENRSLLGADRTPGCMDGDENGLAGFLHPCKGFRSKGLGVSGECRCNEDGACRRSGEQRGAS
jgi:hypothetical protein